MFARVHASARHTSQSRNGAGELELQTAAKPTKPSVWLPKSVRAHEAAAARKREKIAWLKKMYGHESDAAGATQLPGNTAEQAGDSGDDDEDDDDEALLAWCADLDYERYVCDWSQLASTPAPHPN